MDIAETLVRLDKRTLKGLFESLTKAEMVEVLEWFYEHDKDRLREDLTDMDEDEDQMSDAEQRRREYEAMLL